MDYVTPTTNLQRPLYNKWRDYTKYLETPPQFIDFSFYALISAALQRRVWIPRGTRECYPNQFIMLAGNPAIGKSSVIDPLCDILKYHLRVSYVDEVKRAATPQKANVVNAAEEIGAEVAPEDIRRRQLFPMPPDSSSLRALTSHLAECGHTFRTGLEKPKIYRHSSSAYFLSDLVSLFKQSNETGNISDFLLTAWDCRDYLHATHGNGSDVIMRCCVTMLAGVQPDVMKDIFDDRLVKSGFLSRCIFVYASKPGCRVWSDALVTPEQKYAYEQIRDYIRTLADLYGPVSFTTDGAEWIKEWHEKVRDKERVNSASKLDHYYGRKDMHIMKLAMAIHFAESQTKEISRDELMLAHDMLTAIEPDMHLAFGNKGTNPLHQVGVEILRYLKKNGPTGRVELLIDFGDTVRELELNEVMNTLLASKRVGLSGGKYEVKLTEEE